MIDKKRFRVSNEQVKKIYSTSYNFRDQVTGITTYELALDLLDAHELIDKQESIIKEMREVVKNIKQDFQPGYHDCTDDGLPQCSWCDGDDILEKTKDYA